MTYSISKNINQIFTKSTDIDIEYYRWIETSNLCLYQEKYILKIPELPEFRIVFHFNWRNNSMKLLENSPQPSQFICRIIQLRIRNLGMGKRPTYQLEDSIDDLKFGS